MKMFQDEVDILRTRLSANLSEAEVKSFNDAYRVFLTHLM